MAKIYCGSGKTRSSQYGEFYNVTVCIDDIPKEFITTGKTGKRFIKINVSKKKQTDQFGNDLSVTVDTFKPQEKPAAMAAVPPAPAPAPWMEDNGDLPF